MEDDPTVKPAWLSTEFWLSVLPIILLLYKALTGEDTSGVDVTGLATLAVGVITAGYAVSRAIQKRAAILAKGALQQQKTALEHDTKMQFAAREHEAALSRIPTVASTLVQGPDYGRKLEYIIELLERVQPADKVNPVKKTPAKKAAPRKRTATRR